MHVHIPRSQGWACRSSAYLHVHVLFYDDFYFYLMKIFSKPSGSWIYFSKPFSMHYARDCSCTVCSVGIPLVLFSTFPSMISWTLLDEVCMCGPKRDVILFKDLHVHTHIRTRTCTYSHTLTHTYTHPQPVQTG